MKKIILFILIHCNFQSSNAQEEYKRPFFTTSFATTLTINKNYELDSNDDGEPFLLPNSLLLRAGFGYQLHQKFIASVHTGFDYHWGYNIIAIPTYGTMRFNISESDGDALFIESSYGKLWRMSKNFSNGNYYGIGIGFESENSSKNYSSIRLKYHRKSILGFKNNRLDSFSIGMGFTFF